MGKRRITALGILARAYVRIVPSLLCFAVTLPFAVMFFYLLWNLITGQIVLPTPYKAHVSETSLQMIGRLYGSLFMNLLGSGFLTAIGLTVTAKFFRKFLLITKSVRHLCRNRTLLDAVRDYNSDSTVHFKNANALGERYAFLLDSGVIVPYSAVRGVDFLSWVLKYRRKIRPITYMSPIKFDPDRFRESGISLFTDYGTYPLFDLNPSLIPAAKQHLKKHCAHARMD